MEGILKFNLPDEEHAFQCAQDGEAYEAAAQAFAEYIFRLFKHRDPKKNELELYEEIKLEFSNTFEGLLK